MIVALTERHFRDLMRITGMGEAVESVEKALGADFSREADRFAHRDVLHALFQGWFAHHTSTEAHTALSHSAVLAEQYRSFEQVVESGALAQNPLFAESINPASGASSLPDSPPPSTGTTTAPVQHRR
jgi:2-methylfumaryl-CoA isomerase